MSVKDPNKHYTGSALPYTYGSDAGHPNDASQPNRAPTLPSMSSLLNPAGGSEYAQPAPGQRQSQPPYNTVKQSSWGPQANASAPPTQYLYQPPPHPSPSYFSQSPTEGVLLSQPRHEQHDLAASAHRSQPFVPRRQAKHIHKRNENHGAPEDHKFSPRPSRFYEQEANSAPYPQDHIPFAHREPPPSATAQTPSQLPNTRTLSVATLLSEEARYVDTRGGTSTGNNSNRPTPARAGPRYTLRMRQEPIAARACGFGERDRRVIDPPPILQMDVTDSDASAAELSALLRTPYSVVHCTLWDPQNDRDDTAMPSTTDKRQQRRLMGTLVASPFVGKDEFNVEGCFFTFPDLSVRTPGTYSLRFQLVILNPKHMGPGASSPVQSVIKSAPFNVYNAKDFGGMRASTALTKCLKGQGCLISVKKGNTKTTASRARHDEDDDDDEDEDEDDEPEVGSSSTPGARGKRSKR